MPSTQPPPTPPYLLVWKVGKWTMMKVRQHLAPNPNPCLTLVTSQWVWSYRRTKLCQSLSTSRPPRRVKIIRRQMSLPLTNSLSINQTRVRTGWNDNAGSDRAMNDKERPINRTMTIKREHEISIHTVPKCPSNQSANFLVLKVQTNPIGPVLVHPMVSSSKRRNDCLISVQKVAEIRSTLSNKSSVRPTPHSYHQWLFSSFICLIMPSHCSTSCLLQLMLRLFSNDK